MAEPDDLDICFLCQKPIPAGEGRYRVEKGAAHTNCYERSQKKVDSVDPRGPKGK